MKKKVSSQIGWHGDYFTWNDAVKETTGYNDDVVLRKVKESLLKVKKGEAVYERDSVLFYKQEYSWPFLSCLMYIAAYSKGKLNVVDFGGSLGSSYFQNKRFFKGLEELSWNVVEQEEFVSCGNELFEDDSLKFSSSLDECLNRRHANVLLLSSVLPYLENPYNFIKDVVGEGFEFIIVDRTGFTFDNTTRLTVQKVDPEIYDASYPCWFFSKTKFLDLFSDRYDLLFEFDALDEANIPSVYKGFCFKKKS
ncbi:TIGR04325 family methyltransferase [Verrucomicrobiota bacterium]